MNQIFGQEFIMFWKLRYRGSTIIESRGNQSYFLSLHFIYINLLINKDTKIAVNSTIQYLQRLYQRKQLPRVWSVLFNPPQKDGAVKFFVKLNWKNLLIYNIFKLHKYQTCYLIKMHYKSKIWFANNKFSLWKSFVFD